MTNNACRILLIEDEKSIRSFMNMVLSSNGYDMINAKNSSEANLMIASHCPDLILLDLGLPDGDGMNILRKVREQSDTPIIVVSARTQESDKVAALDAGADDYITKPFGTSELLARVRTALRHASKLGINSAGSTGTFTTGALVVDYDKRRVYVNGVDAHLTQNEYKIVSLLSMHAGKVMTYDSIIKLIWGPSSTGNNQLLRVNMANIRRKIEKNPAEPEFISTEMGVGYRMADKE